MIEIRLEEQDLVAAAAAHQLLNLRHWTSLTIFVGLPAAFLVYAIVDKGPLGIPLAVAGFIALFLVILRYWTVPRHARRAFHQQAAFHHPVRIEWDEQQFRLDSKNGTSRLDWSDIFAWHPARDIILIYLSAQLYHLVPARAFATAEDRAAFERLLTGKGVPLRRKRWR